MEKVIEYVIFLLANVLRYFIIAGIAFLIFYYFFPNFFKLNKIQAKFAKNKDFIREVLHSMQTNAIIAGIILITVRTPLEQYTRIYRNASDYPLWYMPVSIILALIIHDTYFYWLHRTIHHPKLFNKVHLLHHKSINPSPFTSYSFHFFEGFFEALIAPIIAFTLPIHPVAFGLFATISFTINVYGHLGYEVTPKWFRNSFLFQLLNTSTHHNLHHTKFNGNYGLYFRIWDRLLGTEHPNYVEEFDKMQQKRFGKKN